MAESHPSRDSKGLCTVLAPRGYLKSICSVRVIHHADACLQLRKLCSEHTPALERGLWSDPPLAAFILAAELAVVELPLRSHNAILPIRDAARGRD